MCLRFSLLFCCSVFLAFCGCKRAGSAQQYPSLPEYDLTKPTIISLRSELDEISGLVYYPKDTSIFAITDETGNLYKIYVREKIHFDRWKFASNNDFEDLALVDSSFFALKSNGNITKFRFFTKDSLQVENCEIPLSGTNEFEIMYFDKYYGKLILICKDCQSDNKKVVSAYAFDPKTKLFDEGRYFELDATRIASELGVDKVKFKPSAAAIHPITKELYIISSINKAIVIADRGGAIKKVYPIDPTLFKQPEGLCFTPKGDLLISNEFADVGASNILIFKYKPAVHE